MKKYIYSFIGAIVCLSMFTSCDDYDDSGIKEEIADLEDRITTLEGYCSDLNSQISSIKTVIEAIESAVYVTSVTTLSDGYLISFSNGTSFTINNGSDGEDGSDGSTPIISVTIIDGVYYWTINGDLVTDSEGNYLRASAQDGSLGTTPQLKIENGYWYVSYDGGETWEILGEATDSKVRYITTVSYDDNYLYITLYDGTVLSICMEVELDIDFDLPEVGITVGGQSIEIAYTINGADENTIVKVVTKDGYKASLSISSISTGYITITAPEEYLSSSVSVYVSNEETTIMRIISIRASGFIAVTYSAFVTGAGSGEVIVPVSTNIAYSISIPDDVDWLSYTETRATRTDSLVLAVSANETGVERNAILTITAEIDSTILETILITQTTLTSSVNSDWSVTYVGKDHDSYNDIVTFEGDEEGRYVTGLYIAEYVEGVGIDSLLVYRQELLDEDINTYDSSNGEGSYVTDFTYTANNDIYYDPLQDLEVYYAIMFGVDDSGKLTGEYKMSERFTPEVLDTPDTYFSWIGTWNYTDNNGTTGTLTISRHTAGYDYRMVQNAEVEDFPEFNAEYNSDGTVTIKATNTGETGTYSKYTYTVYWWGVFSVNSSYVYGTGTGYDVAIMTLGDDGLSATISSTEVTFSSGTGTTYRMGYFLYVSSSRYYTYTYAPWIYIPVDMTFSTSTASLTVPKSQNYADSLGEVVNGEQMPEFQVLE